MTQSFDKESVRRSAKAKDLTLNYYEAGPVEGGLLEQLLHARVGPGPRAR